MKIARYQDQDRSTDSGLYCYLFFTAEEFETLNEPRQIYAKIDQDHLVVRHATGNDNRNGIGHVGPYRGDFPYRARVRSPLFPGTKPFGIEPVVTCFEAQTLICELPNMEQLVQNRARKAMSPRPGTKNSDLANIDTGVLVREINGRRRADKRLVLSLNDGHLVASITYE